MRFLGIEAMAVDELVSDRYLQSSEFDQGNLLVEIIKGASFDGSNPIGPAIRVEDVGDGRIITFRGQRSSTSKWLVVDLEQCGLASELESTDLLFVFQKLCRFCKKIWGGMSLTFAEQLIKGSSKAVLFPFKQYQPIPYRIVMEREPWNERLTKRGQKGNFLLAYKSGQVSGNSAREEPDLTNFRKAFETLIEYRPMGGTGSGTDPLPPLEIKQLQVANLADSVQGGSPYRSFEDWMALLTTQQKKFVSATIIGPHRIEGAAGTGKTLCLMLKAVVALQTAKSESRPQHLVFVTHSDATKRAIREVISVLDGDRFYEADRSHDLQSLRICTLTDLCSELLRQTISETEFIDRDAMDAKSLQLLYIEEALDAALSDDFPSHQRFLSPEFASFMSNENRATLIDMLQHEISVLIKGRASENLDTYRKIAPLKYGMPIQSAADKGFVFAIFRKYQDQLRDVGQFDTDDVVLTATGQLDTPIWRRRRQRDGYDAVFIDETHLFNINELHIFHFFTSDEMRFPIVYSVDRSQAVGDRGWTTADIGNALSDGQGVDQTTQETMRTIFRSSPEVVSLAFSIVASGATLFTNFDNPMDMTISGFTDAEERLTATPTYFQVANEEALIEAAFLRVEQLQEEMGCRRSDVLLVSLDESIVAALETFAAARHKPHFVLKQRGDLAAVRAAKEASQVIIGHSDFVGGLEFFAVVIVGVDAGRVPPSLGSELETSKSYLSYASHNRLYVAVTRAKYRVEMIGEKARGPSKLIEPALQGQLLEMKDLTV